MFFKPNRHGLIFYISFFLSVYHCSASRDLNGVSLSELKRTTDGYLVDVNGNLFELRPLGKNAAGDPEAEIQAEDEFDTGAQLYEDIAICVVLVLLAGLMSGLTVGLMSIDELKLRLLAVDGTVEDQKRVTKVKPILKDHHLLLVTLLLVNASAMEALPIFLDRIVPSYLAVIISVTFVLIFGEILPQAFCTKDPLKIGASSAWIVRIFMFVFYPISKPIAMILDKLLGHGEGSHILFKRSELRALVNMHRPGVETSDRNLTHDEVKIIRGALEFTGKTVESIVTVLDDVYMLPYDTILNEQTMAEIMAKGHSRIPVYEGTKHNVIGVLLVKQLITIDPDENRPVSQFATARRPLVVAPKTPLFDMLNLFQEGSSHLALITEQVQEAQQFLEAKEDVSPINPVHLSGIVTLEDVMEELIQEPIADETDENETWRKNLEEGHGVFVLRPEGWSHGQVLQVKESKVFVRVPGHGDTWMKKNSPELAPGIIKKQKSLDETLSTTVRDGWLKVEEGRWRKKYKMRWIVLTGAGRVKMYSDSVKDGGVLTEEFTLSQGTAVTTFIDEGIEFGIEVQVSSKSSPKPSTHARFGAASSEEQRKWMDAMHPTTLQNPERSAAVLRAVEKFKIMLKRSQARKQFRMVSLLSSPSFRSQPGDHDDARWNVEDRSLSPRIHHLEVQSPARGTGRNRYNSAPGFAKADSPAAQQGFPYTPLRGFDLGK